MAERRPWQDGNEHALRHGAEAAVKCLTAGRPLRGLAGEIAEELAVRLHAEGPGALLVQAAVDRRAVSLRFLGLALDADDAVDLGRFCARFSWLNHGAFIRMRDAVALGVGDRGGLLQEMEQAAIDQMTMTDLLRGLTVGEPDAIVAHDWAALYGNASSKSGLMFKTLAEIEQQQGGDVVVDYEQVLAESAE